MWMPRKLFSNVSCKKLGYLLAVARVPPAANQVECHPVWQQLQLRDLCRSNGVHLSEIRQDVLSHPVVVAVAEKLRRTSAQVALGYLVGSSLSSHSANRCVLAAIGGHPARRMLVPVSRSGLIQKCAQWWSCYMRAAAVYEPTGERPRQRFPTASGKP